MESRRVASVCFFIRFFTHQGTDLCYAWCPAAWWGTLPTVGKRPFKAPHTKPGTEDSLGAPKTEEAGIRSPNQVTSWFWHCIWLYRKHILLATIMNAKRKNKDLSLRRQGSKTMQDKNQWDKDSALQKDFRKEEGKISPNCQRCLLEVNLSFTDLFSESSTFPLLRVTQRRKRKLIF